jgi:heme O synthase-like polyprenyltransferase
MSPGAVVLLIGLGAGAIALWIDVRLPGLAPRDLRRVLLHVFASLLLAVLLVPPAMNLLLGLESPIAALVAVFGVAFPTVVYSLLAGIWFIRLAHGALGGMLR